MTVKAGTSTKLDVKAVREILIEESKFITRLWDNLNLPVQTNEDSDYLTGSSKSHGDAHNKNKAVFLSAHNKSTTRAKSLQELHEKLESLRGKKLTYRDKLLKKGLKNRVLKKRKKDEKKVKKNVKTALGFGVQSESKPKMKPIYNNEGKMVFSKFDFSESGFKSEVVGKKEKEEKSPHKILKKLEKQNEKLKTLETEGEIEKVTEIREKIAWKRALNRSEGVKVKDNPELLKKTIKREIKQKQKSKKKWDTRIEGMKNRQDEKQRKRTENIQARKKQVKINKMKKAAKKGRIIPGF